MGVCTYRNTLLPLQLALKGERYLMPIFDCPSQELTRVVTLAIPSGSCHPFINSDSIALALKAAFGTVSSAIGVKHRPARTACDVLIAKTAIVIPSASAL
jgi:hypothetical protein